MASGIVEVPIMGLSVWRTLLSSGDSDLIHRAAVAIRKFFLFLISPETAPLDSCFVFFIIHREFYSLQEDAASLGP